jgi:hypothetical protein
VSAMVARNPPGSGIERASRCRGYPAEGMAEQAKPSP